MISCPQCSTENLNGSTFCDECGAKLGAAAAVRIAPAPPAIPPPPQFANQSVAPKPATPFAPPPIVSSAVTAQNATSGASSASGSLRAAEVRATRIETRVEASLEASSANGLHVRARLIIQRGGQIGKEFPLTESESLIGRWDADGGIFPDVDLDQDDPEAKVSRRHARIHWSNNQYAIEDLGSTNGTFVNRGPRLLPGNKQSLKNGDEIIVGKTFLKLVTQG
jgi:hypothetical protein